MLPQPKLTPRPLENLYELLEDYTYICTIDGKRIEIAVPARFLYNGASIPAVGWIITYTPFHPDVMAPALVHDYLYINHVVDREAADSILYQMLIDNGVTRTTAEIMFQAVRVGGSGYWV